MLYPSNLSHTHEDLAVIFRPGLISHPNHEMSPQEHQLSQRVLEFLIEKQDWFMLDIPPPPSSGPASPSQSSTTPRRGATMSDSEDILLTPSSDEDHSQVSGGWKLVGKQKKNITRRRTTLDASHSGEHASFASLSPVR